MQTTIYTSNSAVSADLTAATGGMDPKTLASLDFGLFRALTSLGTSRERICATLRIDPAQYDYIASLA